MTVTKTIKLLSMLIPLFFASCHQEPIYVKMANQEVLRFSKQVKQENNLKLIGSGGGMWDKVNRISLTFSGEQKLNIQESRLLFIQLTQNFLEKINSNEEIRPYLANYPFTPKNLNFAIFLPYYKPEYSFEEPKYITTVSMSDDYNFDNLPAEIMYTVMYQNCEPNRILHTETYEDALQKVSRQQEL